MKCCVRNTFTQCTTPVLKSLLLPELTVVILFCPGAHTAQGSPPSGCARNAAYVGGATAAKASASRARGSPRTRNLCRSRRPGDKQNFHLFLIITARPSRAHRTRPQSVGRLASGAPPQSLGRQPSASRGRRSSRTKASWKKRTPWRRCSWTRYSSARSTGLRCAKR